MKKIFLLIAIASVLISQGCSLDEPAYGTTNTENFYKNESDIELALTGVYLQFRRDKWHEYALNHFFIGDVSTDDALKGGFSETDRKELREISSFNISTENGDVATRWDLLFHIINRANDIIYYSPNALGDSIMLTRYANEAKALRGFAYYMLVTTFGDVPYLTKPMTASEILKVSRSSASDIYSLIESDLKDAAKLPSKKEYSSADAYRATRGFAKTMLAKSYLFRGDFKSAEKVLHEIVEEDKDYDLFTDYGYNWRQDHENGVESIFEIPYKMYDKTVEIGTLVPYFFTSRAQVSGYEGYGFHVPSRDLYNSFDLDDPRITYIFTQTGDRYEGDSRNQNNSQSESGLHDYKMTVPRAERTGYDVWMVPYNIRLIRYADVLLLYAEALNENGKSAEALPYLNKIRKRARETNPSDPRRSRQAYVPPTTSATLPDITTTNQELLRKAIWHERRCELAMEGWRRDDLMRQKRFGEVMRAYATKYNTEKGQYFDDSRDYLFPIPQGERDKSNGVLTQNTGF